MCFLCASCYLFSLLFFYSALSVVYECVYGGGGGGGGGQGGGGGGMVLGTFLVCLLLHCLVEAVI